MTLLNKCLFDKVNGNCRVQLFDNGTRIVETLDPSVTSIELTQPLSLDINISNRCSNGCPYCYAGNTSTGKIADLLQMSYLDGVSGLEIAINIQYPLPENFESWLEKMKNQKIIVNGTINQLDFERDSVIIDYLKSLKDRGLLHGIGISYRSYEEDLYNSIKQKLGNDVVIHTIAYITPIEDVKTLLSKGFKVLILGYKIKNRGIDYFKNISKVLCQKWDEGISDILNYKHNSVLAFDTMGLEQLNIKDHLSKDIWNESYQGDEGSISFYIDAVNNSFNIDSHTLKPAYIIGDLSIEDMFKIIKENR